MEYSLSFGDDELEFRAWEALAFQVHERLEMMHYNNLRAAGKIPDATDFEVLAHGYKWDPNARYNKDQNSHVAF